MKITITSKEVKVTEAIKEYVEKKLARMDKYFDAQELEDIEANVTIKTEKDTQIAEMYLYVKGTSYKAVTESRDLYASIDKDIDILEGQIRKMKTKKEKQNMSDSIRLKEELNSTQNNNEVENEIIKTLYYDIKPMAPEDAKLELQEKAKNNFLTFINIDTGKVNVIYRLKDSKNYGLVEPEA